MNLAVTIELRAGGPGSGCRGSSCGRPSLGKNGFIGNLSKGKVKGLAELQEDPDDKGTKMTSFWVAPNGDVYRESDLLGPGFHEHWEHAMALMKADPKEFDWIKRAYDDALAKEKGFGFKYKFVDNVLHEGGIRAYCSVGKKTHWEAGIAVGNLDEQKISRIQSLVDSFPTDSFNVDWIENRSIKGAQGTGKEVMREIRQSFYKS